MPKPLDVRHVAAWSLPACRVVTLASNVFGACVWVSGATLVLVEVGRWRLVVVCASVYACSCARACPCPCPCLCPYIEYDS